MAATVIPTIVSIVLLLTLFRFPVGDDHVVIVHMGIRVTRNVLSVLSKNLSSEQAF